jgi:hypothetical protein
MGHPSGFACDGGASVWSFLSWTIAADEVVGLASSAGMTSFSL